MLALMCPVTYIWFLRAKNINPVRIIVENNIIQQAKKHSCHSITQI